MKALISSHSGLRYIVLALLIVALFNALSKKGSGKYTKKDKMINLFAMIFVHIQLLLGIVLYFMSPKVQFASGVMKNAITRFFTVEHSLMMIIAVVLITIGRRKAEKTATEGARHKQILIYYGLGLLLIFLAIPWPFLRDLGAGYF